MRDKLYIKRFEVCLTPDEKMILKKLSKKYGRTMNEIIRQALSDMWEKV